MQFSLYSFLALIASSLSAVAAYMAWKRRVMGKFLALLNLCLALWCLSVTFEFAFTDVSSKVLISKFQYIAIQSTVPLVLLFSLQFTGNERWITRRFTFLLWVVPVITIILAFTNEYHTLIWSGFTPIATPVGPGMIYSHGQWYPIIIIYNYSLLGLTLFILLRSLSSIQAIYRRQVWLVILAVVVPLAANLLYNFKMGDLSRSIDLTPIAFSFTGIVLLFSMQRYQFLDLTPITSNRLLDTLPDAIFVVNMQHQVIGLNESAGQLVAIPRQKAIGRSLDQVLAGRPSISTHIQNLLPDTDKVIEITTEVADSKPASRSYFNLRSIPITNAKNKVVGRLINIHDITLLRKAQTNLSQQAENLQTVADISSRIASHLGTKTLLPEVVELTRQRFQLYHVQVYLLDEVRSLSESQNVEETGAALVLAAASGPIGQELVRRGRQIPVKASGALTGRAAHTRQSVVSEDTRIDADFLPNPFLPDTLSELALPLIAGEQLIGVIDFQDSRTGRFSPSEISIFSTLASQIAVALQNAQAFDQASQRQQQLVEALQIAHMGHFVVDMIAESLSFDANLFNLGNLTTPVGGEYRFSIEDFIEYILHPDERETFATQLQEKLHNPETTYIQFQTRFLPYGTDIQSQVYHVLVRASVERDEAGQAVRLNGSVQDITQQVQDQVELGKLATTIQQASVSVILTDLDGVIVYANPYSELSTGYSIQELIGQKPSIMKSGHQSDSLYKNLWQTIISGDTWQHTLVNRRKDGSLYYEDAIIFPIKDPTGKIINYAAVKRDITAQIEAEVALRQQMQISAAQTAISQQRERYVRILNNMTRSAIQQDDFQQMLQELADRLGELLNADHCYITLYDEHTRRVTPGAATGQLRDIYKSLDVLPGEETLTVSVFQENRAIAVEDVFNSSYISPRAAEIFPFRSMLGLPLIANAQKFGAALIAFDQSHQFTETEINLGEQAASQIALAIAKARALEASQQRAQEAETLRQAVAVVAETLDLKDTIQRILEQLSFVVPYESASVQLLHEDGMEIVGGRGFPDVSLVIGTTLPLDDDNPATQIAHDRHPRIIDDVQVHYQNFTRAPHDRIHAWMGIPLVVQDRMIGLISLDHSQRGAFTSEHARLAIAFANPVAIAIENARLFQATQQTAITDSLTGLFTRRHFFNLGQRAFDDAARYKRPLSAIMLDIDHFKQVNDTYGHAAGDRVLQTIADLCRQTLRKVDIIGRYGGEEFVILLPETGMNDAQKISERLNQIVASTQVALSTSYQDEPGEISVTISLGVCTFSPYPRPEFQTLPMLINFADSSLYISKQLGRNRVTVSKPRAENAEKT